MNEIVKTTSQTPIEVLLKIDEEGYTTARNLYEFLELAKSQFSRWAKTNIINNPYAEEDVDYFPFVLKEEKGKQTITDYKITLDFAYELAVSSLSGRNLYISAKEKEKKLSIFNKDKFILEKKEMSFKTELIDVLKGYGINNVISQYRVLSYSIDFYIPELNIAIEYDENEHKDYSYEAQQGRQKLIEDEINCKFIRVSDEKSNAYNLGIIFKEIVNSH